MVFSSRCFKARSLMVPSFYKDRGRLHNWRHCALFRCTQWITRSLHQILSGRTGTPGA
jgi:hypothetical protein